MSGMDVRQVALVARLTELGVNVFEYESDWNPDLDGAFEIALESSLPTLDGVADADEAAEAARHSAILREAGLDVLGMNAAGFEGYSEYTPDPGDVRRVRVRFK